jgi:hypothetical protein
LRHEEGSGESSTIIMIFFVFLRDSMFIHMNIIQNYQ